MQQLPGDKFHGYSWGEKSPYQGKGTVESICSSVALAERLEQMTNTRMASRECLVDLDDDHELWDHAANALANLCVTLILTTSIEKIVLGGGIMKRKGLIEKVRNRTLVLINGYLELPEDMSDFITLSHFGSNAGLVGAIVLAQKALVEQNKGYTASKEKEQTIKRTAYNVGLKHGILVGLTMSFVTYSLFSKPRNGRR
jgi:fructokinase